MEQRRNERPKTWFRSDRVYRENGEWFFHTREGIAVGPYDTRFDAQVDAGMLKSLLRDADSARARAIIREFMLSADTTQRADFSVKDGVSSKEWAGSSPA